MLGNTNVSFTPAALSTPLQVLRHLLYLLKHADKSVQRRVAATLAHLCPESEQRTVFSQHTGLDVLLDMLANPPTPRAQREAAVALCTLHKRASALKPVDTAPPPPTPQVIHVLMQSFGCILRSLKACWRTDQHTWLLLLMVMVMVMVMVMLILGGA